MRLSSLRARHFAPFSTAFALCLTSCVAPEIDEIEGDDSTQALVLSGVTFQTVTVPRFLGATNNGGSTVVATATTAQAWETFKLDDVNGGALESGDAVFIQAGGGQYFQAVNGGGSTLNAASASKLGWETFKIVRQAGAGVVKNGDIVGLQASTGTFVRPVNGGGAGVDATGAAFGGWEALKIGGLTTTTTPPPVTGDPTCSTGILNGTACCPAACGACGGTGCGSRPGGTAACCTGPITTAAVSCSGSKPPCVVTGSIPTPPPPPPPPTNAPRAPGLTTLANGRGATAPYAEYEAEAMQTNGTVLASTRAFGQVAAEASGRQAVRLAATGQYVQFSNAYPANSIVLRYSIPDSGANYWTTLSVYVNGAFRTKLTLTSRYSWTYGTEYQFTAANQNDPALGTPHHFFDETHALIGDIPVGATVQIKKDSNDGASRYDIDLVDLEQVTGPFGQPAGYLHLQNDCGAIPNDGRDDSATIQTCMDRGRGEGRGVYIPQGVFNSFSKVISVAGVTVKGAGMWYSSIEGFNASFDCWGNNCKYSDFSINGDTTARLDSSPETAFRGAAQSGSSVERMWIEHIKVGMFSSPNSSGISIKNSRFRALFADGVNFWAGTINSVVENCHFRGTGDDSLAAWSDSATSGRPNSGNVFRKNYVQAPWKANCFGIYGGQTAVEDNVCADTVQYPGVLLATQFNSHPFSGTTRVDRNSLLRAGGWTYNQEHGALKIHADFGAIYGVRVNDLEILDPSYYGVHVQGQKSISDVILSNVQITHPSSGVFFLNWGANGSMTANNVVASGAPLAIRNDTGGAFNLIRGSGNSGW